MMQVASKHVWTLPLPRQVQAPQTGVWMVERLPSRVIQGRNADGFRFTRTIPASKAENRAADTVIEEDWVSYELNLILERKISTSLTGTRTEIVSDLRQAEPDPALFAIPSDYTVMQDGPTASH